MRPPDPNRPSIGIMSFSGEIFDGTAVNLGEGKAYGKLKRCAGREHAGEADRYWGARPRERVCSCAQGLSAAAQPRSDRCLAASRATAI